MFGFADEAIRLIRQKWKDANSLAQEMFAIITSVQDKPAKHDAPLTLTNKVDDSIEPTLKLRNFGDLTAPAIRIDRKDGSSVELGTDGAFTTITPDPADPTNEVKKKRSKKPIVSLGKVAGGSGKFYSVDLYDSDDPSKRTSRVKVEQILIAAEETIPVGTPAIVLKIGDKYFMQVPVWM